MAALLQAITTEQNANTVQVTAPQTTNVLTDGESITLASNEAPSSILLNLSPNQPIYNLVGSTTSQVEAGTGHKLCSYQFQIVYQPLLVQRTH